MFLVVVAMAPILWFINNHFRRELSRHSRSASESFSRVTATLAESVGGMRVTQGFVRQETNLGLFRSMIEKHMSYTESAVAARVLAQWEKMLGKFV